MSIENPHRATSASGLRHKQLPMRLWRVAKALGIWDPEAIDLSADRKHWRGRLDETEREALLGVMAHILRVEEACARDVLPMLMVLAASGELEEEMFLTSALWEDAKHLEAWCRWLDAVAPTRGDMSARLLRDFEPLFRTHHEAFRVLRERVEPGDQARAMACQALLLKGVVASACYSGCLEFLTATEIMPGLRQALVNARADMARHIAYGVYLLARLAAEHGDPVWSVIDTCVESCGEDAFAFAEGVIATLALDHARVIEREREQLARRIGYIEASRAMDHDVLLARASEDAFFQHATAIASDRDMRG